MKYTRKGAIRFLKVGRFGISWWWSKPKKWHWRDRYETYGDMERIVP